MIKRRMLLAAMAALGAIAISGSALSQDNNQNMTMMTPSQHLSVGDQIFLMNLLHANAREIELSRIAYHNAGDRGLSEYAHRMIKDHVDLQKQLLNTYGNMPFAKDWPGALNMQNENYGPNDNLDNDWDHDSMKNGQNWSDWNFLYPSDWNEIHNLRNLSGRGLDVQYIQDMVTDHSDLMWMIDRRKGMTQDTDIQSLISNIEPTVQMHLERARGISFGYDDPFDAQRADPLMH